jgi:CheY-like chemotaxis protein
LLLAEDNAAEAQIVKRALRDLGAPVDLWVVRDGEEALDYLLGRGTFAGDRNRRPPDLVLLDLNLPKLTGLEVLAQVRGHADLHCLPVVMWTTSKKEDDIRASYAAGANSYIEKPRDYDRFRVVLDTILHYWFDTALLPSALSPLPGRGGERKG